MSKANVLVFNHEQLDERYHYSTQNNRTARLVKEALSRDYQIALVHKDGLSSAKWLTYDVQIALELSVEHSSTVHIWTYIEPLDILTNLFNSTNVFNYFMDKWLPSFVL